MDDEENMEVVFSDLNMQEVGDDGIDEDEDEDVDGDEDDGLNGDGFGTDDEM